jgi:FAD/FMN-containing dehydrogenase
MQSYSDFSVGGALSVNAHGRYVGAGPVINSVRRIELVLANGQIVEATPEQNSELFYGAIGGYGGLGVITEAELELVPDGRLERHVRRLPIDQYPGFFEAHVAADSAAIFHNADIDLYDGAEVVSVTWSAADKPVSVQEHLIPRDASYPIEALEIWALANVPGSQLFRRDVVEPLLYSGNPVVWRNHETSISVASLGPLAGNGYCYALQEYFVPVGKFRAFASDLLRILGNSGANVLNVSVRHSPADPGSLLAWAREAVFSFVLFYRQGSSPSAQQLVGNWARGLIDAALALGGSYYLPYQLHATPDQFARAYPGAERFFEVKSAIDPRNRFRNRMWEKYYHA